MRRLFLCLLAFAVIVFSSLSVHSPAKADDSLPTPIDLGTLGGEGGYGNAINNKGEVAGGVDFNGKMVPFHWDAASGLVQLPSFLRTGEVRGINEDGLMVGVSSLKAVLWKDGEIIDLGSLGGVGAYANAINSKGAVVGCAEVTGNLRMDPYIWENGVMTTLPTLSTSGGCAQAISNNGLIAGYNQFPDGTEHAVLWKEGQVTDLGTLSGDYSIAYGVNDKGQVVGQYFQSGIWLTHPFIWENGIASPIGGADMTGYAAGINNEGIVVGDANAQGFIYQNGIVYEFGDISFKAINDSCQIAGYTIYQQHPIVFPWSCVSNEHFVSVEKPVPSLISALPNTEISITAAFNDTSPSTTHSASWDWGDGSATGGIVSESSGTGVVSGSHRYQKSGLYLISVSVTSDDGVTGENRYDNFVIHQANEGILIAVGKFDSPAQCLIPSVKGAEARIELTVSYIHRETNPSGILMVEIPKAGFKFKASSFDWMLVIDGKAYIQAQGTINGKGHYLANLVAMDSRLTPEKDYDRLNISIQDPANPNGANNSIFYQNPCQSAGTDDSTVHVKPGTVQIIPVH